eukprot:3225440-Alexandrium_andersonii.AAC.1
MGLWRASLCLLAAASAAGLVVELHHCRGAFTDCDASQVAHLARLQLRVCRHEGHVLVTGASIAALRRLVPWAQWTEWQTDCACKVKTAIVPAGRAAEWAAYEESG